MRFVTHNLSTFTLFCSFAFETSDRKMVFDGMEAKQVVAVGGFYLNDFDFSFLWFENDLPNTICKALKNHLAVSENADLHISTMSSSSLAYRVVSRAGLFGSGSGRVRAGFGPEVDKNFGLNSGLRCSFCLRCTKV